PGGGSRRARSRSSLGMSAGSRHPGRRCGYHDRPLVGWIIALDLIADIGATNTRCGLVDDKGHVLAPEFFKNKDFSGVEDVLRAYLDRRRTSDRPRRAALAIAAPIVGDEIDMVNRGWRFSRTALAESLGFGQLTLINDFAAIAWALPSLGPDHLLKIGGGAAVARAPMVAIGPGTGLG